MRIKQKTQKSILGYLFISLWIIGFLLFTLWPLIQTFNLSLNSVRISTQGIITEYIGFGHYQAAFLSDVTFSRLLISYFLETVISVPLIIVFALLISMMLNEGLPGQGIFRTMFFLPVIITTGPVIAKLMDQGSTTLPGLSDFVDSNLLLESFPQLIGNLMSYLIESFIVLLWFTGVQILVFLAGLQQMNASTYEAAKIDGASRWEIFWKITLPSLKQMITLNVVFTVVSLSTFDLNEIVVKISDSTFDQAAGGLGYASALSWIYFLAMLLVLLIFVKLFSGRRERS